MTPATFFVVWCPTHGAPSVRHASKDDALQEARRLASNNPGREFFVLCALTVCQKTDVIVTDLCGVDAEMPF